jgi:hypothetical protein
MAGFSFLVRAGVRSKLAELRGNEPRLTGSFCFCSTVSFVTHTSLAMIVDGSHE